MIGLGALALFLLKPKSTAPSGPVPVPVPGPGPGPQPGPPPPQPLPSAGGFQILDPASGLPLGPQASSAAANTEVNPGAIASFPATSVYAMLNPVDPTTGAAPVGTVDTTQLGAAGALNVHQGPDLGSPIIGSLSHGDTVKMTALIYLPGFNPADPPSTGTDEKELYQVQSQTSKTAGFVSSTFVKFP